MIIPKELITLTLLIIIIITSSFLIIEICYLLPKLISKLDKSKENKEDKKLNDKIYKIKAIIETNQKEHE